VTTTIRKLRYLINEALYRATAPERFKAPALDVEADNTLEAGRSATKRWFEENGIRGIDDMSVSLEPVVVTPSRESVLDEDDFQDVINSMTGKVLADLLFNVNHRNVEQFDVSTIKTTYLKHFEMYYGSPQKRDLLKTIARTALQTDLWPVNLKLCRLFGLGPPEENPRLEVGLEQALYQLSRDMGVD